MQSKTIFFFCYRILEFRLFLNTGILKNCASESLTVLIVPPEYLEDVKKLVPENTAVEPLQYTNFKGSGDVGSFSDKLRHYLHGIFSYIYPIPSDYKRCLTQAFQMDAFWRRCKRQGARRIAGGLLTLGLAWLGSRSASVRALLQRAYLFTANTDAHQAIFDKYKPDLVVVGSMGLDADGLALIEAKRNGCRSVVTTQTWDRSTCKGYPTIQPDDVIAWSQHMADEIHHYQLMPREHIHVEGAPVWDHLFRGDEKKDRKTFLQSIGLSPDKPVVYYPMSSDFWHRHTISTVQKLMEEKRSGRLKDIQFIFRLHPYYLRNLKKRDEIRAAFGHISSVEGVFIDTNEISEVGSGLVLSDSDKYFQANCYFNSDLSISVVSTCMVESVLCDLPAINMEFGRWETGDKEVEISNYTLHHLYRIYSYGAIARVHSLSDVVRAIHDQLENKHMRREQRNALLEGETPVNRGTAAVNYAQRLIALANHDGS